MTTVSFEKSQNAFSGVRISGHSGYAESGSDIVCAAISSSVDFAASVLEKTGTAFAMDVGQLRAVVEIRLDDTENKTGQAVFAALYEQFSDLAEQFPRNIKVTSAERIR